MMNCENVTRQRKREFGLGLVIVGSSLESHWCESALKSRGIWNLMSLGDGSNKKCIHPREIKLAFPDEFLLVPSEPLAY
jgi:hypothetical protein